LYWIKAGTQFLEYLNKQLDVRDGKVSKRPLTKNNWEEYQVLCISQTNPIDFVIEGPDTNELEITKPATRLAAHYKTILLNTPRSNTPLKIAIFPCSGTRFKEKFKMCLKNEFPNVTWYFPRLRFSLANRDRQRPCILADAFVKEGIFDLTPEAKNLINRFRVMNDQI